MLRLFNIPTRTSTGITFTTFEISQADRIPYVVYDTSTGIVGSEDYYCWRTVTSTGAVENQTQFTINDSVIYPSIAATPGNYLNLNPRLLHVLTFQEAQLIDNLISRIDLVRRRLPNPGRTVNSVASVGENGNVSFAGGFEKKFSIKELIQYIEGAIVEINIHPPATENYWWFTSTESEKQPNPYRTRPIDGVPYQWMDLIVQGAMIRALIAWGILEVDVHFTTSDNGLSITYDRVNYVSSWFDKILNEFKSQKDFVKWDSVNSYGVAVGTVAFAATGLWGAATNMISQYGILPMNSLMGFSTRAFTPL